MINYHELRQQYRHNHHKMPFTSVLIGFVAILLFVLGISSVFGAEEPTTIDISVISQIESSNDPSAYNKSSHAIGLCQITPVVLKEFNKFNGTHYDLNSLFIDQVNLLVADWYMNYRIPSMLEHFGIADTVRNRLWAYNAGIGNVVKHRMPKETKKYIAKYEMLSK